MTFRDNSGNSIHRADSAVSGAMPVSLRAVLFVIIAAGLALRVVYPGDTAFCEDQAQACALAEDILAGEWQTGGLINSGGFRNLPGFVYILAAVWWVWPDPHALLYFTSGVNVLAVLLSAYLMRRWIGAAGAWWGTAFLAVGPWAIHYSRWIWAQDLLFPAAVLAYFFLWKWLCDGKRWAALGLVLALALLVQIHLVGVVLSVAVGLLLVWRRPKLPMVPLLIGAAVAIASVIPYLLDGHVSSPEGNRLGYEHFWRVIPGAAMSLTGSGWQLEFRAGYPDFAASLSWRRWPYEVVMVMPVLLFAAGLAMGLRRLWQDRGCGTAGRCSPLFVVVALSVLIPVSFDLLGLRTSPRYLPVWYPLPFALMAFGAAKLTEYGRGTPHRVWIPLALAAVLMVELAFFGEQLRYIRANGGVPGSLMGRSYTAMQDDIADLASQVDAAEVWMVYAGPSVIQDEPAAYLLRHAAWAGSTPGRVLVHFGWGRGSYADPGVVEALPQGTDPPPEAYRVRPWHGPQQVDSEIPRRP